MWRLTLLVSILLASSAGAQSQSDVPGSPDIWVELKQNTHALRVAIPELAAASPDVRADAAEIYRILFDDISFASVFRIVDPERYKLVKTLSAGFDYHGWESIGSDIIITGTVARENQALRAAIHVHAVENEKIAFSTVYTEYRGSTRNLAHNVANRILAQFGLVGIATTDIVFASDRDSKTGSKNLWMMDYDGFGQRAITRNRYLDFQPRFSPDGAKLSFLSYPKKNAPPVLAIHGEGPLLEGPGMVFSASWSPDGKRIAFSSTRDEAGNAEIYVMNRDGTAIRRLTHHPGIDVSPSWSPTGRELVFTSERTGSPQIFVMDAEGLNLRRLSRGGSYNAEPFWSPSKIHQEIAYASRVEGRRFDIVVYDLTNRQLRQLTSQSGMNESASWSPGGSHLVFTSTRSGEPQVFIMNRDGGNQRQLTFEGTNTTPSWAPLKRN